MTTQDRPTGLEAPLSPTLGDLLRRWLPLVVLLSLGALLVQRAATPLGDPDVWWHLRLGDDLWRQGSLRAPTDWSPRQSVDWVPSEPLPEIVAARLEHWGALPAVAWLYGLTLLVVLVVVYWICRRESGAIVGAVVGIVTICAMLGSLTPRPQLISFVLLALVPVAWDRVGDSFRPPWWLIPMTWLWSMCHGFWVLGVGLSGLCWLGLVLDRRPDLRSALRLATVPAASLAVVALNPAGWQVLVAPLSVSDTTQYISEWARTSYKHPNGIICAVLLVVTVGLMLTRRRAVRWTEVLLLMAAVFFWWYALRTIAVSAIVAAPLLSRYLGRYAAPSRAELSWRRELQVLGVGAVVGLVVLAVAVPRTSTEPADVPTALSDELDRVPPGTGVLNLYSWGGWLAWRHPDLDRTADGLVVPYDPDYIGRLLQVEKARGDWLPLVDGLDVDYALMRDDTEVSTGLEDAGWNVVGRGDDGVLLARPGVSLPD